jgi:HK97 family phage major capsid protein
MSDQQPVIDLLLSKAEQITTAAKSRGGPLTEAEARQVNDYTRRVQEIKDTAELRKSYETASTSDDGPGVRAAGGRTSIGFASSDLTDFRMALAEGQQPPTLSAKANFLLDASGIQGEVVSGVTGVLREPFRLRSLFTNLRTEGPSVHYRRINTGAAQAATVSEGALKPEATIVAASVEAPVRKIAAYLPISDEVVADGGGGFLDEILGDLVRDVIRAENAQLLSGNGTAPNLRGLLQTSGILTRARGTDSNLDALIKAVTQLRTTSYLEPTDVVLNPANFEGIRLSKTTDGAYLLGNPLTQGQPQLMGATIHLSTDIPAGTGLVLNAPEAATVYVRQDVQVKVGTSGDQWQRNLRSFIAEERLAFAVKRPSAVLSVTALN